MVRVRRPKAIILDIDGTTTSMRYISETLFPFIRKSLKEYLLEKWGDGNINEIVDQIRRQTNKDIDQGIVIPPIAPDDDSEENIRNSVVGNVLFQMEEKRQNKPLKDLQILIWVYGYETGRMKGHVFPDVPNALHQWKSEKIKVYIYSAGMVEAQKLLFAKSTAGNLLPLIKDFFDFDTGPKTESSSFRNVSEIIEVATKSILFITDNPKEAAAAMKAGCNALVITRPGNRRLSSAVTEEFQIIKSFEDITFEE